MYRSSRLDASRPAGDATGSGRRRDDTRRLDATSPSVESLYSSSPYFLSSSSTVGHPSRFSVSPSGGNSDTSSAQAGQPSIAVTRGARMTEVSRPPGLSSYTPSYASRPSASIVIPNSSPGVVTNVASHESPRSSVPETSSSLRAIRSSASPLSGRPFELSCPRETSRSTYGSSLSTNSLRPDPSSEPGIVPRAEATGEKSGFLCNKAGTRDSADWNMALKTSDQSSMSKAEVLRPKDIALHEAENRRNHHTDKYEHSNLIIRRGQSFDMTLTFNRAYNSKTDDLVLQFAIGCSPQESKGTIIRVPVGRNKEFASDIWFAKFTQGQGDGETSKRVQITPPENAIVGRYYLFVETKANVNNSEKPEVFRYKYPEEIIVLFNPWCKDDTVHLYQEALREEYVLNDHGLIWMGSVKKHSAIPWNFGQFEDVSLNTCLCLLDKAQLSTAARANPIRVTRCITAMANYNDQDGGVLWGRWDGNYPDNTHAPTSWSGSVAILEEFWKNKDVVKFAQCWVFSGLVTTLLRAIGIPTRSVTNFASAHDTDASMTIDFHFDENGKPLKHLDDSIWNFHVWNESWFRRPDLPDGHDGWQALDATPQEKSHGVFRCGPASVRSVKQGEVYLPYDTSFVFGEVNGDRVFWEVEEGGPMKVIRVDTKCVGKLISTKAVGNDAREDITHEYKHPEGSSQERRAVQMAYKFSSRKDHGHQSLYELPAEDVKFSFEVPDALPIGENATAALKMKNSTRESRTVKGMITGVMGFYNGIPCKDLKEESFEMLLEPRQEKFYFLEFPPSLYLDKCEADGGLKIYVKATVQENGQRFASYETLEFRKPEMTIELTRGQLRVGNELEFKLSFLNPLPVKISGGKWYIETTGSNPKTKLIPNSTTVPQGGDVETSFRLTPYREGLCRVSASFRSPVLSGVRGCGTLQIAE
ncbi:protein-glutamine gamma-glutamyltransferase K-like [Montipora foliosa]|uniref:protein-glutamine gamma-glutamyltransferase K-like n=1 Tax=Montipora foliosa TaxID=591990 RepID=UPI0035F15585